MNCEGGIGGLWPWLLVFWVVAPLLSKLLKRVNQGLDAKTATAEAELRALEAEQRVQAPPAPQDLVSVEELFSADAVQRQVRGDATSLDPATRQALAQIFGVALPEAEPMPPPPLFVSRDAERVAVDDATDWDEQVDERPSVEPRFAYEERVAEAPQSESSDDAEVTDSAEAYWTARAAAHERKLAPVPLSTPAASGFAIDKNLLQDAMILGAVLRRRRSGSRF